MVDLYEMVHNRPCFARVKSFGSISVTYMQIVILDFTIVPVVMKPWRLSY